MADATRIQALRLLAEGQTVTEVARRTGKSIRTIRRWKSQPSPDSAPRPSRGSAESVVHVLIRREGDRLVATVEETEHAGPAPAVRESVRRPEPGETIEHEYAPGELDGVAA